MIKKVLQNIVENNMFQRGDKVIVALSGGPDSMCLLHILHRLMERLEITLVAAHVNHCLRGEDSDGDEAYVKESCAKIKVECYSAKVNIHKLAQEKGISCEMAGREARYAFFEQLKEKVKAQKIALAHNSNDQAETILMRLMRGTGIDGLTGIQPVRDEIYVRPILVLTREEVENYCVSEDIQARIDKSNLESIYARNKVRLELIPYMKKNFNSEIVEALNRLSDILKKDKEYLEQISIEKYKTYCKSAEGKVIILKEAFLEHEAILSRIIRMAVEHITGTLCNLEKVHIYDIIHMQNSTGKRISLPNGIIATSNYGEVNLLSENIEKKKSEEKYELEIGKCYYIEEYKMKLQLEEIENIENAGLRANTFIKFFDLEKIKEPIYIRSRKEGDRFTPLGMEGKKKLKDIFMDLKIPKGERDHVPLLCFGEEIGWIVGYRVSNKFKIDENSKKILRIKVGREEQR